MGDLLKGKVAIVTGSGQGIGRGIALGLAREGARVVTNNRKPGSTGLAVMTQDQLQALTAEQRDWVLRLQKDYSGDAATTAKAIQEMGGEAVPFFGDVTRFDVAAELVRAAINSFGTVDILVNVVGAFRFSPVEEMEEATWDYVFNVKPKAYFNCIRHAVPHMLEKKWGRILNCTSQAWAGDRLKHCEYAAANAAVVGLTRAVANELFDRGVMCNAFSPWARTRASFELEAYTMLQRGDKRPYDGKERPSMFEITPGPEELGPAVAYLSSDLAAGVSGTVFNLGGNSIGVFEDPDVKRSVFKAGSSWTIEELKRQMPRTVLANYHSRAKKP